MDIKDDLFISNQGLFGSWWSEQEEVWVPYRIRNQIAALRKVCEIKTGTTLRDIMELIRESKHLTAFLRSYSHISSIEEWLSVLDEPSEKSENFISVQLGWQLDCYGQGKVLDLYPDICIIGESTECNGIERFALDTNFHKALDLPFIAIENPQLLNYEDLSSNKFRELESFKKPFTLLDILDAVLYDISFFGSPASAEDFAESLNEQVAHIKDEIKECKILGKPSPLITVEQLREDIDKRQRERVENPCKYCGKYNNAVDGLHIADFDADVGEAKIVCSNCHDEIKIIMFDPEELPEENEDDEI